MRRITAMILAGFLILLLSGCDNSQQQHNNNSNADYKEILSDIRTDEDNKFYPIVTNNEDSNYELTFGAFGGDDKAMKRYAISVSAIIIKAYGVGIILPAEGELDAVVAQVENYILSQQKAFENYLPDQYKIAKNAVYEIADTGEVVFAVCEEPQKIVNKIKEKLK